MRKVLILLAILHVALSLNISLIESQYEKLSKKLTEKESNIAESLLICNSFAKVSSVNLKASKIAKNLTNSLDTTASLLMELKTLKNYESFESFANFSTCDYVSSRQSTSEIDLVKLDGFSHDVLVNLTMLLRSRNNITANYAKNFKTLVKFWSQQRTVISFLRQIERTTSEFLSYIKLLNYGQKFMTKLIIYLKNETKSLNCSATVSSFQLKGEQMQAKLGSCEGELLATHKTAMNKVQSALKSVTATSNSSSVKLELQNLLETLTETSTVDDYANVKWPNLPDVPSQGIKIKLRTCQEKKRELFSIEENCVANQSKIAENRKSLESVKASVIDEVKGAIIGVEENLKNYAKQLEVSIQEIDKTYNELVESTTPQKKTTKIVITTTKEFEILPEEITTNTAVKTSTKELTTSSSKPLTSEPGNSSASTTFVPSTSLISSSVSKTLTSELANSSSSTTSLRVTSTVESTTSV